MLEVSSEPALSGRIAPGARSLGSIRWIGFSTMVIREYGRIMRIWAQTLVPAVVSVTLYFIIFGKIFGRRVGAMEGFSYVQYIAPGLIMMQVITTSYANVVSSFFGAKFQKYIEELLVSPLPDWLVVAGYMTGGMVRGLMVGVLVTAVSLLFARLPVHHLLAIVAAALLTSAVFSLGGFLNALFARNMDQVNWVPTFVLTPLTYLGGVFYALSLLPAWARRLTDADPILYMVSTFRYGFLGRSDVSVSAAFALMLALAMGLFGLCVLLLKRGVGVRE